jgi:hypothetical protein
VRIAGQLIDTSTGAHIWADRFDGALNDIFELQDQVASGVVGAIEPKLRQSDIERASRRPTESLDAYELYLRVLALRDIHTDESVRQAVALLKRALAIDPNYMPGKAAIGWSGVHKRSHARSPISEAKIAEAVGSARQALGGARRCPRGFRLRRRGVHQRSRPVVGRGGPARRWRDRSPVRQRGRDGRIVKTTGDGLTGGICQRRRRGALLRCSRQCPSATTASAQTTASNCASASISAM